MTKINFSIVLASRDRPELLNNLLKSIRDNTENINQVEVLVGIDHDDTTTQNVVKILTDSYPFMQFHSRKRSSWLNRDYLNWLYNEFSKGDYIIVCNDDVVFETKNWDIIMLAKLNSYLADKPDGIVYGYINDALINRQGLGYCCFPLISRAAAEAAGFAIPPEYPAWSADVALWRVYSALNRICDISEVMIKHISHHSGTRPRDSINNHVQNLSAILRADPNLVEDHIKRISEQLNKPKEEHSNLLGIAKRNYEKTRRYYAMTGYDPKLDGIWENNMSDIANIAKSSNTAEELIDKVDQTFMYSINFPPENGQNSGVWKSPDDVPHIREKQIDWLLKNQLKLGLDVFNLPENIQESTFVHKRNQVVRNGKVLTGNFLRTLSIADRIFKCIGKDKIKNIIELGGGCGHQARTLSLLIPDVKYTIIDLPETLLFSFTYISLNFPDKKILYVSSEKELKEMDEYDFVFVPAVFANKMHGRSYDLFINTASMGEMRNDVIHGWMDFIQNKINVKYLFTLNRFLNIVDEGHYKLRSNCNECSTSYDHKWSIINWELEPLYCRCPYIDTLHSRYVEIIASRPAEINLVERSNAILADALDEDWYRLKGMYGDGIMQARSNVLVNDTTMNGPLFKIWESIRLDQNVRNVSAMIEYIDRITVSHPLGSNNWCCCEEKFYYESLLNRLR